MAEITPKMIKDLRDRTGIGMGKCKDALTEANGDMQTAIDNLRKAGMTSAVKKEGRETKEGLIGAVENKKAVALVEVNAETDFVVQNEKFSQFLNELCAQALDIEPKSLEQFLQEPYVRDPSLTIEQCRNLMVQSFGENVVIRRVRLLHKTSHNSIGIYIHMGGKVVSVIEIEGATGLEEFARQIAMHAAAEDPEYLDSSEVPEEIKLREEEIAKEQVKDKPKNIIDKIVAGKIQAFYDQTCLLNQKFIKDTTMTVAQVVEKKGKELHKPIRIKQFIRWKVGH